MKKRMYKEMGCCLVFFLALCGFWAADMLCGDKLYSGWEKRLLAQKPEFSWSSVADGSYGAAYEEWMLDQFPARDWWIQVKTRCEFLLGKKEAKGIYMGKDGYMFAVNSETTGWDLLEQQMKEQFGGERVSRIRVPSAGEILTDKVPGGISFTSGTKGQPFLKDAVFQNLLAHREEYIYYRTDHHWTMRGAYYAYEAWAKGQGIVPLPLGQMKKSILKEGFLGTHYAKLHYAKEADTIEFYDPGTDPDAVYDLGSSDISGLYQERFLGTEDAYRFFLDGNHGTVQISTGRPGGHLVVLKDSYANCLIPFLTLHYSRITVVDPRHFRMDIREWLRSQPVTDILILSQPDVSVCYTSDAFH